MGQVVIHASMSLDGYIAGPNDDMSWMSDYVGPNKVAEQVIRKVGAIVAGGRYFRVNGDCLGASLPYGGAVSVPVFIVTHHPRETITRAGVTFHFISDGFAGRG